MSDFKNQVDEMKESMISAMNSEEEDKAFISSDIIQEDDEVDNNPSHAEDAYQKQHSNQRNERGHRKRKSVKDRISAVIADNKSKDAQINQQLLYIQEQERRLAEIQAKADQSAHYTNVYYEQSLENDEQRVTSELEFATENGDIKKQVELQRKLAEVIAARQTQQLSKTIQKQQQPYQGDMVPNYYQQPVYNQPYNPPSVPQEHTNEHLEDFLDENPWADPESSEFDPNLSSELNQFAVEMNKNLRFNHASNVIGSQDYYRSLSDEMKRRYSLNEEQEENNNHEYVDNHAYEVAPVSRRGSSMADRYVSNNQNINRSSHQQMALSPMERKIATNMAPQLSKIYGRPVTPEEAIVEYFNRKTGKKSIFG